MSTFDGVIREFPEIRVDFFRGVNENPPLACFLSHIHSDHLAGLETFKGRHIFCSAATRAMLLKLQRRSSRINFHQGLYEREEITYKHQIRRLKSLPLETATDIQLEPGNSIRVTLLNANHCPGAVMFLFEGDGKAVLYTGDIRSEPWHVDYVARSPCMIQYVSGLKTLDRVYLDTSFTEDHVFQTKADGLRELIKKVLKYPKETKFYFSAWTYGYEEVWIALANALNTQIHVDDYKLNMYKSLQIKVEDEQYLHLSPEAAALTGFARGNDFQPGILTRNQNARLHSCEKGTRCSTMAQGGIVFITPIIAHLSDTSDLGEIGIGGGAGDLEQNEELILSSEDARTILHGVGADDDSAKGPGASLPVFLLGSASAERPVTINIPRREGDGDRDETDEEAVQRALDHIIDAAGKQRGKEAVDPVQGAVAALPSRIKFPYSRHSSYRELCHLLELLRPKDIWPCTVDTGRWVKEEITVQGLFGSYCTGNTFDYDKHLADAATTLGTTEPKCQHSQSSINSADHGDWRRGGVRVGAKDPVPSSQATTASPPEILPENEGLHLGEQSHPQEVIDLTGSDGNQHAGVSPQSLIPAKRARYERTRQPDITGTREKINEEDGHEIDSQGSSHSAWISEIRQTSFNAVLDVSNGLEWEGLLSTTNHHRHDESELGED